MNSSPPGVVLKTRFIQSHHKAFSEYVSYINREEAIRNKGFEKFSLYNDYMGNPEKTSGLFTSEVDSLNKEQIEHLKHAFEVAQKNGSLLWQDVISFDNAWLEKYGVFDPRTNVLNEHKLMQVTRSAMRFMEEKENLIGSSIWSAAIHYNTDNIHVHVATIEPIPTRERGKRKPKTLEGMKSKVVQGILDRNPEYKKMNELIRITIVGRKNNTSSLSDKRMKKLFVQIVKELPEDKRQWQYHYKTLEPIKPLLNELSTLYIEKYHREDFTNLNLKLDKEEKILKEAYGEGDKHLYKNYKQNKLEELFTRLGNSFLKEMKQFVREEEQEMIQRIKQKKTPALPRGQQDKAIFNALKNAHYHLRNDFEAWKNQQHFERLQQQIEHEHERG